MLKSKFKHSLLGYLISFSIVLVCAGCEGEPSMPPSPKALQVDGTIGLAAQYDPATSSIDFIATPPSNILGNPFWVGYVVYLTDNQLIDNVGKEHFFQDFERDSAVEYFTAYGKDSADILHNDTLFSFVVPGSGINDRKMSIAFKYRLIDNNGMLGSVRLTRVSETRTLNVAPRASLGCKQIERMTTIEVDLCLDKADIISEGGKPMVRYIMLDTVLTLRDIGDTLKVGFPEAKELFRQWLYDTGSWAYDQAATDSGDMWHLKRFSFSNENLNFNDELTIAVMYMIEDKLKPGQNRILLEFADLKFKKEVPLVKWQIDSSLDDGNNILREQLPANFDEKRIVKNSVSRKEITITFPPNVNGIKDFFRVRLAVPIQAPSPYGHISRKPDHGMGAFADLLFPYKRIFPYRYSNGKVSLDSSLMGHIEPGGWSYMQWRTIYLKDAEVTINLEDYVNEFNRLGGGKWYAFKPQDSTITQSNEAYRTGYSYPDKIVDYEGTYTYKFDKFKSAPTRWAPRVVDEAYPWVKPIFNSKLKRPSGNSVKLDVPDEYVDFEHAEFVDKNRHYEFPFFRMPTHWNIQRRTRAFVIQFQFFGDALSYDIRNYYTLNDHALEWIVAAPTVDVTQILPGGREDALNYGAMHLEGLIKGEEANPVSRDLYYQLQVGASAANNTMIKTYGLGTVIYYALIPANQNLAPILDAWDKRDLYAVDSISYHLVRRLVPSLKVDTVPGNWVRNPNGDGYAANSTAFNIDIITNDWSDGIYVLWFGSMDFDFVSGPLLANKYLGPALVAQIHGAVDKHPYSDIDMLKKEEKFQSEIAKYRIAANPRIFKYKRPGS